MVFVSPTPVGGDRRARRGAHGRRSRPVNRPESVRYLGFESTSDGRRYRLQVGAGDGARLFVFVIPHAAFASREARFQDAPDLCFARLQRELETDAALVPGPPLVLTSADFADYRDRQAKGSERKRRRPADPGTAEPGL
jgi:hypothetical protein